MKILLKKQPRKYLASVDSNTRKKLFKALDELSRLEGNIVRLSGYQNRYRYKIEHYRIVFEWIKGEMIITVIEINTRSNIKY
ncbi:MAG: type II toxin-antitoxin system RelE/ParE family toxin [Oscillospiraceae bacterium]|nr:type II toxin-antitoxin system RelE/ParE family toxin [Oscillospiraceae bacterium]